MEQPDGPAQTHASAIHYNAKGPTGEIVFKVDPVYELVVGVASRYCFLLVHI